MRLERVLLDLWFAATVSLGSGLMLLKFGWPRVALFYSLPALGVALITIGLLPKPLAVVGAQAAADCHRAIGRARTALRKVVQVDR